MGGGSWVPKRVANSDDTRLVTRITNTTVLTVTSEISPALKPTNAAANVAAARAVESDAMMPISVLV